jgi:hypothetical protein
LEYRPIAYHFQSGETVLVKVTNQLGIVESRTRGYWKANEYDVIIPPGNGRMRVREENLEKVPRENWITHLESLSGIVEIPVYGRPPAHTLPPKKS